MISTQGGRWGGFGLYLLKGKPVFDYNGVMLAQFRWEDQQPLAAGKHTIVFDFTSDGPGIAKGGSGVLRVYGQDVATQKIPKPSRSCSQVTRPSTLESTPAWA